VIEFFEQCSKNFGQQQIFFLIIGLMVALDWTIEKNLGNSQKVLVSSKNFSSRSKNI